VSIGLKLLQGIDMKSMYKKFSDLGNGGISCRCCCNLGGKPLAKRLAKRKLERAVKKLIKEVLNG
jgi:hypothetical protein